MKLPSKIINYNESILSKFPVILEKLRDCNMCPFRIYHELKSEFKNVEEFIETLDCLYALNKIKFLEEGVISYVDWNLLWKI